MNISSTIIQLEGIHKQFGDLKVLQGLDFAVRSGEVYGLLGRNGVGKSTAIQIMMGIIKPDKGRVTAFGDSIFDNLVSVRRRIGYVSQEQHFYPWMTPRTLGRFVRRLYPNWDQAKYLSMVEHAELPLKRKVGGFSTGMKAKLALALALATKPELLILDEPTAGMDPVARREFLNIFNQSSGSERITTLFSSHLMDDVEAVANQIGIIHDGAMVYQGEFAPLANTLGCYSIDVTSGAADNLPGAFAQTAVRKLEDGRRLDRRFVVLQFEPTAPSNPELNPGWRVEAMTLEDVFLAVVSSQR